MSILTILVTGPVKGGEALITCEEGAWRYLSTLTDSEDLLLVTHGWGVWICGSLPDSQLLTLHNTESQQSEKRPIKDSAGARFRFHSSSPLLHMWGGCRGKNAFLPLNPLKISPSPLLTPPSTWLAPHTLQAKLWAGADLMSWPSLKIMPWTTLELLRCLISSPLVSYGAGAKPKYLIGPPQMSFDSRSQGYFVTQMSPMCWFHVSWSISSISPHIGCNVSWRDYLLSSPHMWVAPCLTQRRPTATRVRRVERCRGLRRGEESWTATDGPPAVHATFLYWKNTEWGKL